MATPSSTPRYPGPPNPTPISASKTLRPPIHNPYDKFTQPQFDEWISGITGALKRALGRDDAPPDEKYDAYQLLTEDDTQAFDDSFAEVFARRLAKGKERAREENLVVDEFEALIRHGDKGAAVQKGDEAAGNHYGDEHGWGEVHTGADYSSEEDYEDEAEGGDTDEEEESPGETGAEVIELLSDDDNEEHAEDDEDIEEEEDDDQYLDHEDGIYELQYVGGVDPRTVAVLGSAGNGVTEILESDEEAEGEQVAESAILPPRKPVILTPAHTALDADDAIVEAQDEEIVESFPPRTTESGQIDIPDPWQGPSTYAEDFYSGGDMPADILEHAGNPHLLPTEQEPHTDISLDFPDLVEGSNENDGDLDAGSDASLNPANGVALSHLAAHDDRASDTSSTPSSPNPNMELELIYPDPEDASPPTEQPHDADTEDMHGEIEAESLIQDAQGHITDTPRSPSPPSLNKHVNWNWPPAFPGRVVRGSGHLSPVEDEIVEISEDDEDDLTPPNSNPREDNSVDQFFSEGTSEMPFSLAFEELYDIDAEAAAYQALAYEPVGGTTDFGVLPPTHEELSQDIAAPSFSVTHEDTTADSEKVATAEDFFVTVSGHKSENGPVLEESFPRSSTTEGFDVATFFGEDTLFEEVATEECHEELEVLVDVPEDAITKDVAKTAPALLVHTDDATLTKYPAPISAGPDPTDAPVSPVDSIASSSGDKEPNQSTPIHAALVPVFRKATGVHSMSGLFTPMTDGPSGSVTPNQSESEVLQSEEPVAEEDIAAPADLDSLPIIEKGNEISTEDLSVPGLTLVPETTAVETQNSPSTKIHEDSATHTPAYEDRHKSSAPDADGDITPNVDADADADVIADSNTNEDSHANADADGDVDADAEGELDLEYVPPKEAEVSSVAAAEEFAPTAPEADDDPFIIKKEGTQAPPAEDTDKDSKASIQGPQSVEETSPRQATAEEEPSNSQKTDYAQHDENRPLKRKRKSYPTGPVRITRSKALSGPDQKQRVDTRHSSSKSRKNTDKGKQRAPVETDDEDDARSVANSVKSDSSFASAIAAQKLLEGGSRESSRASSVVSNGVSVYSEVSPTVGRTLPIASNRTALPFIRDNGVLRHNHGGRAPAPVLPPPPKRQPSNPPVPQSRSSVASSREIVSSSRNNTTLSREESVKASPSVILHSVTRPPPPTTHSPATRSNCRYHTISLPREEDDERHIFFAVPGCSLSNTELMEEEDIKDHGLTRTDELPITITPIEDLTISLEVVAILRQLTGVDLYREQEVIYLPRLGDDVVLKKPTKPIHRESISARTLSFKDATTSSKRTAHKAPLSQVSASTSGRSASVVAKLTERANTPTSASSLSEESELSDLDEDENERPLKRSRPSPAESDPEDGEDTPRAVDPPPNGVSSQDLQKNDEGSISASAAGLRRPQPRRGKKLKADALAYKPEEVHTDVSDEGADTQKKRRPGKKQRGVKRARMEEHEETQVDSPIISSRPKRRRRGEEPVVVSEEAPQS